MHSFEEHFRRSEGLNRSLEITVLGFAFFVVGKQWQRHRMSSKLVAVDQDDTGRNGGSKMDIVSGRKKIQ